CVRARWTFLRLLCPMAKEYVSAPLLRFERLARHSRALVRALKNVRLWGSTSRTTRVLWRSRNAALTFFGNMDTSRTVPGIGIPKPRAEPLPIEGPRSNPGPFAFRDAGKTRPEPRWRVISQGPLPPARISVLPRGCRGLANCLLSPVRYGVFWLSH